MEYRLTGFILVIKEDDLMKSDDNTYIYPSRNKYVIRKTIYGKRTYYGTFETLQEARKYRDFLVDHAWNTKYIKKNYNINRYIKKPRKKYYISKRIDGKDVYFGTFETLQEAREYRDFLEEHEWNPKYRKISRNSQWNKNNLPKNIYYNPKQNTYAIRKVFNQEPITFGTCHTLEEAVHERDFWMSIDWDMDMLDLC